MTTLAELKKLAESATPGPWEHSPRTLVTSDAQDICEFSIYEDWYNNCDFIAAANPQTILKLLADVESMKSALEDRCWTPHHEGNCVCELAKALKDHAERWK